MGRRFGCWSQPSRPRLADPELAAFLAYMELTQHSLETAAGYVALAGAMLRRSRPSAASLDVTLAVARLRSRAGVAISSPSSARWRRSSNPSRQSR